MNDSSKQHISFSLVQVPSQNNGHVAIVSATNAARADFGAADPSSAGTNNIEDILNLARERAAVRVLKHENLHTNVSLPPTQGQSLQTQPPIPKEKNNGGGSKPASEKQRDMIAGQCRKRGIEPNELCHTVCNRPLHELQGQDAHAIIQHLKNN